MKTINEKFTDEEYNKLLKAKKKAELNWHDFILLLIVAKQHNYCEACRKEMEGAKKNEETNRKN